MNTLDRMDLRKLGMGKRTLVMGIINITPDSFSDGGRFFAPKDALEHALSLIESGADILDIGAESTRPGHEPVSLEQEWERLAPVIDLLRQKVDVPLSIDTYKAEIARSAIELGADIINDIWGGLADPMMYDVVAKTRAPYILMHNSTHQKPITGDVVGKVKEDLLILVNKAIEAGVKPDQIILDPGVGFGKTVEQNLQLINRVDELGETGYPVLMGTSRKSVIGHVLGLPVEDRVEGTAATVALSVARGADIVRVHDVKEMARVVAMCDAMVRTHVST